MGVIFDSGGGNYDCEAPDDLYERCMEATPRLPVVPWFGNANRFIHPIGCSRPGYGAVLLKRKHLYALESAVDRYEVTFNCFYTDGQVDTRTFKNLRVVGTPICVTPGVPQDEDATMFVELADRRVDCVGLCGKRYNWRIHPDAPYETASLNSGVAWTWTLLLTDLWNCVGNLGTMPALPVTPAGTPEQVDGMGCRAADLLDDLLMLCGMGVAYDPTEDTFSIVSFSANANNFIGRRLAEANLGAVGQRIDDRQDRVIWDPEPIADNLPKLPAYVRVVFPVWSPGGTPIDTATYFVVDVADTTPDATELAADAFVLVQDFFVCRTNQVGDVLNTANLLARAADVAGNWFKSARKASFYPYHQTFSGIAAGTVILPGAALDVMCWEDIGDGAKTHIIQTGRLGFAPIFHDTHTWVSVGQLLTGHPFGTADKLYRFPLQSTNQADPIQRGANIPPGELRTYGTGPFASASGNTSITYAGGGGMSSIMDRIGPLRQWDSAVEARSVDGHGQRMWLAKKRPQHLAFVKVTSVTPSSTNYPAIEQFIEPITKAITAGDVCWWYDPNGTAPTLNSIHLSYLDGSDGGSPAKKIYMSADSSVGGSTTTVNMVTNVCPIYNTSGTQTGNTVEYTPIMIDTNRIGTPFCVINPDDCCPVAPITTICCPNDPTPYRLCYTVSGLTGNCAVFNGSYLITWNGSRWEYLFEAGGAGTSAVGLACQAGPMWQASALFYGSPACNFIPTGGGVPDYLSCSPFLIVTTLTDSVHGQTASIIISEDLSSCDDGNLIETSCCPSGTPDEFYATTSDGGAAALGNSLPDGNPAAWGGTITGGSFDGCALLVTCTSGSWVGTVTCGGVAACSPQTFAASCNPFSGNFTCGGITITIVSV